MIGHIPGRDAHLIALILLVVWFTSGVFAVPAPKTPALQPPKKTTGTRPALPKQVAPGHPRRVPSSKPAPPALWSDSDEWRMVGANEGHTQAVTCKLHLPLRSLWRVDAAHLGAPAGEPAYLHPRTLAYDTLLVEMDTPEKIVLLALNAETGAVRWRDEFSTPTLFPDAGLYPAEDDEDVALFLQGGGTDNTAASGWNLSCLDQFTGKLEWETGPLSFDKLLHAPQGYHTLCRPVVSAGPEILVAPDFFGRPPLVAFNWKDGTVEWRNDRVGGDVPTVALSESGASLALAAGYVGARPLLRTALLKTGGLDQSIVGAAVASGPDWKDGVWDSQVRWTDVDSGTCCVEVARLRQDTTWPAASCVLSLPGIVPRIDWVESGPGALAGPVQNGVVFIGDDAEPEGKPAVPLQCLDLKTGHTLWIAARSATAKPFLAAPGLVLGRNEDGQMAAWSSDDGRLLWHYAASYLRDCIAGDGIVVGAYGTSQPTAESAFLEAFR